MLRRREFVYPRLPFPAHPAIHLPLYLSRPYLRLRPRPLLFRRLDHAGVLPFYPAEEMPPPLPVPYARAPLRMPPRNNERSLQVVKKPFKPSRSRKALASLSAKGRPIDLVEEVRALHALWRAGAAVNHTDVLRAAAAPEVTHTDFVKTGPASRVLRKRNRKVVDLELAVDRKAALLAEVRALHDLWRAGPAEAHINSGTLPKRKRGPLVGIGKSEKSFFGVAGEMKEDTHSEAGMTFMKKQIGSGEGSKRKRGRKNKKPAKKPMLRKRNKRSPKHLNAGSLQTHFKQNEKPDISSGDDAANASLTRSSGVSLMLKREEEFKLLTAGAEAMEYSSFGGGLVKSEKLNGEEEVSFEMLEEQQKDVYACVMEFINNAEKGIGSEQLTPDKEKEREIESFHFFSDLFRENSALRSAYVHHDNGSTVECLVCRSLGETKVFDKVFSLVMHATSRVNKRPEHRGYGRAVSGIVSWNANKAL